jgi:dihydrofolate reductase
MKLTLLLVSSLDGITNRGGNEDHHSWTSEEDRHIFNKERDKAKLIIMGSNTYKGAKPFMEHVDGRLRVVMTRTPDDYREERIPGQLIFTDENPSDLIKRLEEEKDIDEGILVGGANIINEFLKADLVNEIWITIEPWLKGEGHHTAISKIDIPLKLLSFERLNEKGTLHLKYAVLA